MGEYNKDFSVLMRLDSDTSGLKGAEKELKRLADVAENVNAVIYKGGRGRNASRDAFGFDKIIKEGLAKALNFKGAAEKELAGVQRFLLDNEKKLLKLQESTQIKKGQAVKAGAMLLKNLETYGNLVEKAAKVPLKRTDQGRLDKARRMRDIYSAVYEKRVDDFETSVAKYTDLQQRYNEAEKTAFRLKNGEMPTKVEQEMTAAMRERDKLARTFVPENVYPYLAKWGHASNFKSEQEMLVSAQRAVLPLIKNFEDVPGGDKGAKEKLMRDFSSLAGLSNVAARFDSFMGDYAKYASVLEELKGKYGTVLGSSKDPVAVLSNKAARFDSFMGDYAKHASVLEELKGSVLEELKGKYGTVLGSFKDPARTKWLMGTLGNEANALGEKYSRSSHELKKAVEGELGTMPEEARKYANTALSNILGYTSTLKTEIEDFGRIRESFNDKILERGEKGKAPASTPKNTPVSEWGRSTDSIIASNLPKWDEALRQRGRFLNRGLALDDLLLPDRIPNRFSNAGKPLNPAMNPPANNHIIVPPELGGETGGNRKKTTDKNDNAVKNIENSTFWYAMSDATRQIGHVAWRNTLHSAQVSMDEFLKFEGAMTDILKHFAGLRNETTNLPNEKYFAMREKIIAMSKELPLSQTDIALAAGRAARMGIDEPDLLRNVELATKLGVGFNMSPDAVMESIAKIAASSGISPSDNKALMKIGDAINYLDDHTNATGEDIFEFLKDSTAGGKTIGLSVGETAAIGTALMSLGTNPSVAKTAFKNLMLIATSGPRNQKKGERYLSYAGIENEEMMKRMRANPRQGLLWILKKLADAKNNEVGKDTASIIRFVTGQQSALPTMKLTSREGIATLERLFNMLDNAAGGWTEKEYETKMKADPNREMALLENALKELRIEFGKTLFPAVKEFAPVIKDVMRNIGGFMANNPKLVQGMVGGGLAIGASANAMATISDAMIIFDAIRRAGGFKNLKSLSGMFTALSPLLAIQTNQVLPMISTEMKNLWGALKGGGQGLWGVLGGAWKTMTTVPVGNVSAVGTAAGVGGAAVLGTMIGSQIWKYIDENYIIPKQQAEAKAEAESGAARKGRVNNIALERAHKSRLETERHLLEYRLDSYRRADEKRQPAMLPGDLDSVFISPDNEKAKAVRERLDKVNQEIKFSEARIEGGRARARVLPSQNAPEGTSEETRGRWKTLNQAGIDWTEQRQYWEGKKSFYDAKLAENPSLRNNEATMGNYGDIQNKLREIKAFQQEIQNQADSLVVKATEEQKKYFADYRMMNEALAKIDKDRWDNATNKTVASLHDWVVHSADAGGKMKNSFDPVLDSFNAKLDAAKTHLGDIKALAESMKNLNINININGGQATPGKGGVAVPIGGKGGKGGGSFPMSLPGSMGMSFLLDSPTADNRTYNSTANITINNNSPSSQIAVNQWARQLGGILGGANREAAVYA